MTPMRLFLSDGAPAKNWACGKCRIVKFSRQEAEECCRSWTCKTCGDEVSTYRTKCPGCRRAEFELREQNIWEKAQPVEDCELWTCNGEFFEDDVQYVDDALAEGSPVPRVYATRPAFPHIDAGNLIESLMDEMDSDYHMSLRISYPNETDKKRAKELGVSPGGDIMIHGIKNGFSWIGSFHAEIDWTKGCIAVTDEEMDEIERLVPNGTRVEIRP